MTQEEILDSDVFRLINFIIQERINKLNANLEAFRSGVQSAFEHHTSASLVHYKIHEEKTDPREPLYVLMDCNIEMIKAQVEILMKHTLPMLDEIASLQTMKCRLVGDGDFTDDEKWRDLVQAVFNK